MPVKAPRLPGPLDWCCGPCLRALFGGNGLYGAFFGVAVVVALGMTAGLYAHAGPWVWRHSACTIVAAFPNATSSVLQDECSSVTIRFEQDGTDVLFNLSSVHNVPGLGARPSVKQCHATVGRRFGTCWWVRAHADAAITARTPTSTPAMKEGPFCFGESDPALVSPNPGDVAYAWQHALGYCFFLALPCLLSVFRRSIGQALWPSLRYEGSAMDARSNSVDAVGAAGLSRALLSTDGGGGGGPAGVSAGTLGIADPRLASQDKRSRSRRRVAVVQCMMPLSGLVLAGLLLLLVAWPALHDVQGGVCSVRSMRPCGSSAINDAGAPPAGSCCAELSLPHAVAGSAAEVFSDGSVDVTSTSVSTRLWPALSEAAVARLRGGAAKGCHGSLGPGDMAAAAAGAGSGEGDSDAVDCSQVGGTGVARPNASVPTFCCWYSGNDMAAATSLVSVSLLQDASDVFCPARNLTFAKPRVPMWVGNAPPSLSQSNNGWRVLFALVVAAIVLLGSCVPCCALRLSRRMRTRASRRAAVAGGIMGKGPRPRGKGGDRGGRGGRGSHDDEGAVDCWLRFEGAVISLCCCVTRADLERQAVDAADDPEDSFMDVDSDDFSFYTTWDTTRGSDFGQGGAGHETSGVLGMDDGMALGPRPVTSVADPFARGGIMGGHHHGAW